MSGNELPRTDMDFETIIYGFVGLIVLATLLDGFNPFSSLAKGKLGLILRIIQIAGVIGFFWSLFLFSYILMGVSVVLIIGTLIIEGNLYDKSKNITSEE